jgi:pimeloyl-ACP methyl ester carboxylesterase
MSTEKKSGLVRRIVIIAAIAIAALYSVGGGILSYTIYSQSFARDDTDRTQIFVPNLDYTDIEQARYPRSEFRFASGENTLVGYDFGQTNTRGLVIVSSGSGGTGDDYMNFVTRFADDGYRIITYDMTGAGQSDGDGYRGTYQGALDMDALLTYVESQEQFNEMPVYLLGHSWGGYGVCASLVNDHHVNAVVSLAGYNDGGEVFAWQGVQMAGGGFYLLYPHLWCIQRLTFGSSMDVTAIDGINASGIPTLIIQGENDEAISADGISIYAHRDEIANDKAEYLLTDGDHEWLYSSRASQAYHEQMDASWAAFSERPDVRAELDSGDTQRIQAMKFQWAAENNFDKFLYNEIDEDIIERIEALFDSAR